MSDLPVKPDYDGFDVDRSDHLVIEALDEQELRESRGRSAARLRLVWDNRRFLIRTAAWGLVVATLIAFLIPKRYQSIARLMPPDQTSTTGSAMLAALAGRVGTGLTSLAEGALGMKTTGDLFIGVLQSETVEDDLIRKFNLQKLYRTPYIEDARKALASHTEISEDQKSGIITVVVTDRDPREAAAMAQEYTNELNWVVSHLSTSSAHRERVFLETRLNDVKTDLESAEKQLGQFSSQKGVIDVPTQGKAMVEAAATLQGQLIAAESELEGFRQIYTDKNVRVESIQARVNELRDALQKLGGQGATETSTAAEIYPSLRQLPLLGVNYADMLRRVKVQEAVFEILTQEYEMAKVQEAREIPTVKVLDTPEVSQKKSYPPRLLIMLFGTLLALVGGLTLVLGNSVWEAADPTDPRKILAIEVWSSVRAGLPWTSQNGSSHGWLTRKVRRTDSDESGETR